MARLKIRQKHSKFSLTIPHKVWINNQLIGIMKDPEVSVEIPEGRYLVTIQSIFPFIYTSAPMLVQEGVVNVFSFHDREKWWDVLFVIDLVLWFADIFFTLPAPWDLVYKIFTNGYFVLWLVYEWIIRKKYFRVETYSETLSDEQVSE